MDLQNESAQIKMGPLNLMQIFALVVPIILIVTMLWVYRFAADRFDYPIGYLIGYIVYWIGWCLIVPIVLLGGVDKLIALFRPFPSFAALDWKTHLMLWWPIIFPLAFVFIPRISTTNLPILLASIGLGIAIGITEEVLWRGVYLNVFVGNTWLGIVYPSVMFALWHIAPQSVVANRMPGGVFSFVTYALALGLSYAFASQRTGSIGWATVSHILHDSLGLGGFAYAVWLLK